MHNKHSSFFRPEIQGLRGIAVLLVLFYHLELPIFKGGFIGVDIFFVISGYIITKIIVAEIENDTFSLKKFYERRIRRILPAYLVVSSATLFISYLILMPSKLIDFTKSLISTLFFVSNIFFTYSYNYFFEGSDTSLLHTWSLSVEEQFYILYPLLFLLFFTFLQKKYLKFFAISLFLIGILSFVLSNYLVFNGYESLAFYNLPTRSWQLILGALTLILEKKYCPEKSTKMIIYPEFILFFSFLAILFSSFLMDKNVSHPSYITLVPVLSLSLIIFYSNFSRVFKKILTNKFLGYIGDISYSLYLWHFVIIFSLNEILINKSKIYVIFLSILLSFISAGLTYKYLENPFRDKRKISFKRVISLIFVFYAFLLSVSFFIYQQNGFSNKTLVKNIQIDNEILFREFRSSIINDKPDLFDEKKTKVMIVGNSYGRGFYNFIHLNKNLYQNIDVKMFDIKNVDCLFKTIKNNKIIKECDNSIDYQINNINHKKNILNFKKAEIIMFVTTWKDTELKNLNSIATLKSKFPNKKYVIVSKQPEFIFEKPIKNIWLYTDIDLIIDKRGKDFVKSKKNNYLKDFFDKRYYKIIDPDVKSVNESLVLFSEENKLEYLDIFNIICNNYKKKCHSLTTNGEKIFFDNGHISVPGSRFFGKIFYNKISNIIKRNIK